jgi:outer membrane protein assembly factor BamB
MFNCKERSRPITFVARLFIASLLLLGIASAVPSITLSKKTGPPTSRIFVSGRGFAPNVGVDVFFDTKDEALVVTDAKGEFRDAGINAPRSARPGEHWVTALARNNGKGDQKPFLVRTDWAEFHFDVERKGLNPYENVLNPRTVEGIDLKWRFNVGSPVYSSPAVADGRVYFGAHNPTTGLQTFYALDASAGALLWTYATSPLLDALSSPAFARGVVYMGSNDYNMYALNANTGTLLWSFQTAWYVERAPAVVDGVVYFGSDDGRVYALDASTGAELWNYATGDIVRCTPAVANGAVYISSDDGNLYALNSTNGALLWSYPATGAPTVANGVVYVGGGYLYALNASTGSLLWKRNVYDPGSSPAVSNGAVYFSSASSFYALNANTGDLLWSNTGGGYSSPAVANGVVYVGSRLSVNALNARTGALLWSHATGDNVYSSPAVVNGIVYVGCDDGNVYAFGQTNGNGREPARQKEGQTTKPPGLKTLHPDLNLKVFKG